VSVTIWKTVDRVGRVLKHIVRLENLNVPPLFPLDFHVRLGTLGDSAIRLALGSFAEEYLRMP